MLDVRVRGAEMSDGAGALSRLRLLTVRGDGAPLASTRTTRDRENCEESILPGTLVPSQMA